MGEKLSEYELARLANIKKNEEFLKSIGLYKDPATIENVIPKETSRKPKSMRPRGKRNSSNTVDQVEDGHAENVGAVRRSTRNSGTVKIEGEVLTSLSDAECEGSSSSIHTKKRSYAPMEDAAAFFAKSKLDEEDEDAETVRLTPPQLREYVQSQSPKHSDLISNAVRCFALLLYLPLVTV